ncbi:hypothetical protein B7463_g12404, partial [Scytalidium lignicola]
MILDQQRSGKVCMFPISNPIPRKQDDELQHVEIHLPPYALVQRFLRDYNISISSLFSFSWGLVLQLYTNAEMSIFGYMDKTTQNNSQDHLGTNIRICFLDVDDTAPVLKAMREVDFGSNYQTRPAAQPYDTSTLGNGGYNTVIAQKLKTSTSARLEFVNQCSFDLIIVVEIDELTIQASLFFRAPAVCHVRAATATLGHAIAGILRNPNGILRDLDLCSDQDITLLRKWNQQIPERPRCCIHDVISQQTHENPKNSAIDSWDGHLSYGELDRISSCLAVYLSSLGVGPEIFVPLCFEKPKWAIVAILGVIKAGGAYVLMDPSNPIEGMRSICQDLDARWVISSSQNRQVAEMLNDQVVVLDDTKARWKEDHRYDPVNIGPQNALYAVFTSGSTGKPKGVVIEHSAFYARAMASITELTLSHNSRVLQFSSFASQISNQDVLFTLMCGGCICIPSELDRLNHLESFIDRYNVNWACLTPSVVDLLEPRNLPSLQVLVIEGELMSPSTIATWANKVHLFNVYGSSETAGVNALCQVMPNSDPMNIGHGVGSVLWIVDIRNLNKLAPIGAIGEIVVESSAIGRGYIKDGQRTNVSFLQDLKWIGLFRTGTRQRLYRTGDLARYNSDGTLSFLGRKDDQVKIHGQSVELTKIEYHMGKLLANLDMGKTKAIQVVAEVVTPQNCNCPVLVAFLCMGSGTDLSQLPVEFDANLRQVIADLAKRLEDVLPSHMLPRAYVIINEMPMTLGGKKDRWQLRERGTSMTWEQMMELNPAQGGGEYQRPQTSKERQLQRLLAQALQINGDRISVNDNFFRMGGDSIIAMQLVSLARRGGLSFTVADVFRHPRLVDLAQQATILEGNDDINYTVAAFSLLKASIDKITARRQAANLCGVQIDKVGDVLPCTPLQEGILALTKHAVDFTERKVLQLCDDIELYRLQNALEQIIAVMPILRTRIVNLPEQGLGQVVVNEPFLWGVSSNLDTYLREDEGQLMGLGLPLAQFGIVDDRETCRRFLIWSIHHAVCDAWSMNLLLVAMEGHTKVMKSIHWFPSKSSLNMWSKLIEKP